MPLDPSVTVIRDADGNETFVARGGPLDPNPDPAVDKPGNPEEGGDGAAEDAADGDGKNTRSRKR